MSEAIKLFGRRIAVPETQPAEEIGDRSCSGGVIEHVDAADEKDSCQEAMAAEVTDLVLDDTEELDHGGITGTSPRNGTEDSDDKEAPSDEKSATDLLKPEPEQAEQKKPPDQEKVMKKPDKILPCPRCNSMDTKFCYFNNYNVNQPRHFCKNCQRYWTAGGTMRNVPVGAGKRKNKHSSHYRHTVTISEGVPSLQNDGPDSPQCHHARKLGSNTTVLKFGQEAQICDSMASSLNIREQKRQGEIKTASCGEVAKEPTCSSSLEVSNSLGKRASQVMQNGISETCGAFIPMQPLHCYSSPPWAFQWGPGQQNDVATAASSGTTSTVVDGQESGNMNSMAWSLPLMMPTPAFVAPTIPVPLIPAPFWGCMPSCPAGTWNTQFAGQNGFQTPSSFMENYECPGIHSPRLGKHSRDAIPQVEEKAEKSLWVPKTLRIDDPEESAKSSIWATLGIKQDQREPLVKGAIFKSFQPETSEKSLQPDATKVMHANPAALSRSQVFQERT